MMPRTCRCVCVRGEGFVGERPQNVPHARTAHLGVDIAAVYLRVYQLSETLNSLSRELLLFFHRGEVGMRDNLLFTATRDHASGNLVGKRENLK
jgi:hypothetical protein